jgi:DNA-directed RNA polymerase subunit omega
MAETKTTADPHAGDTALVIPGDPELSVYRFIIVAAKRARQLQAGARPKVAPGLRKVTKIAVEETRRGYIEYHDLETAPPASAEEEPAPDQ